MTDNIKIIHGFLCIDCREYHDDLLLLNDLKRTLADNNSINLKGIFVDLRNMYDICSSIIGNIARFYKEKKVIVLLIESTSHVNQIFKILNFETLAKIFYDETTYNKYIEEIVSQENSISKK